VTGAKLDDDWFPESLEDTGTTGGGEGSCRDSGGKSVVGTGAEVTVTAESIGLDNGSLAGATAVAMTGAKLDDGLEWSLINTGGRSADGITTEFKAAGSTANELDNKLGSSSRSLVLLGSNAFSGIAAMLNGNTLVPRNAPWVFSTVTDLLNGGLKTMKKSFFSSFLPAVSRVDIFISCYQACLKLLKAPRSNGCNQ